VSQGELNGNRTDAEYYIPSRRKFFDKIKNNKFVKLKTIIKEWSYWILPPWNSYNENNPITFIRATEMLENLNIDFSNAPKVPEKYYENIRSRLKKWDILIAVKWATIASQKCICFIEDNISNCIINWSIFRFQTIDEVEPKYIAYYLNTDEAKKQMKFSLVANNAVDYLNKDIIESLEVPLPSLETQQKIVEKMDSALAEKRKWEKDSEKIMEDIDEYVFSELWIKLPEKKEEKIYFSVDIKEIIEHKRFDPAYFSNSFKIEKSKYELKSIYDIAEIKKGQSVTQDKIIEWEYPVIAWWQTSPYTHNQKNYEWNIITVSASWAYSWYVRYHENPIFASDCSVVFSKDENLISTFFIYTRLKINQKEIYKMQKWAWQPHVYPDDIWNFIIPLPPIEIQNKIINEVKSRIVKANELKKQANEIYEKAKNEVEKMITYWLF